MTPKEIIQQAREKDKGDGCMIYCEFPREAFEEMVEETVHEFFYSLPAADFAYFVQNYYPSYIPMKGEYNIHLIKPCRKIFEGIVKKVTA